MNYFTKDFSINQAKFLDICLPLPQLCKSKPKIQSAQPRIHFSIENIRKIFTSGLKRKTDPRRKSNTFVKKKMLNVAIKELKKAHNASTSPRNFKEANKNSATTSEGVPVRRRKRIHLADSSMPNLKNLFKELRDARKNKARRLKSTTSFKDFKILFERSHKIDHEIENNIFKVEDSIDIIGERMEYSLINQDGFVEGSF